VGKKIESSRSNVVSMVSLNSKKNGFLTSWTCGILDIWDE
jgi:hypothetical protein